MRFPEIYSLGVAFDPRPQWTLALDVEWVRWSSFDEIAADFRNEVPAAGFSDGTTRLDWRDSWQLKIGADWRLTENSSLRAGYAHIPTPVPERSLEPGNPDANQHNFSVGVGYRPGRFVFDGFYNLGLFERRRVENNLLSGEYRNHAHYLGLSIGYRL
jgi:long-chain fatty acid transport protein